MLWVHGYYKFNNIIVGIELRGQILTSEVGPRAERVNEYSAELSVFSFIKGWLTNFPASNDEQ